MKSNPTGKFSGKVTDLKTTPSKQGGTILDITLLEKIPNKPDNYVKFEVYNNQRSKFENIKVNDVIQIHYNIKGNYSGNRLYTNLHVAGVDVLEEYVEDLLADVELPDNNDLFKDFSNE